MVSSGNLIMSIKSVLISTGVLAVALLFKISVPMAIDFCVSVAPIVWNSLLLWLKPPYLYVVINGIIITIAASSRFHRSNRDEEETFAIDTTIPAKAQTEQIFLISPPHKAVEVFEDPMVNFGYETVKDLPTSFDLVESDVEIVREVDEEKTVVLVESVGSMEDGGDETVAPTSTWNPPERTDSSEISSVDYLPAEEKPLVSARFGHRKVPKTTPEGGRRLKVAKKTKRQETLENTWKMITEGRSMPLTRHMKKSDTWENHGRQFDLDASVFKESETFRDMTNYQTPPPETTTASTVKLRKEPSLSQDELNRRVEAFIKKFNEDMKLQREESLRQYNEMIKHEI